MIASKGNDLPFESHNVFLFEMIYDYLFESVAVSIGEENRNGDGNTVGVAERQGITPEAVEHEMMEAIRAGMASPDPHAQALWKQICPNGKEPYLDTFLSLVANRVDMMMDGQRPMKNGKDFLS